MTRHFAFIPLNSYPEPIPDSAVLGAMGFAGALGCAVHVSTYAVDIPPMASPLGGMLVDFRGFAVEAEKRSAQDCTRLTALVKGAEGTVQGLATTHHKMIIGAALNAAATEARYFDLAILPWVPQSLTAQDMAMAVVFGSGRPVILVPADVAAKPLDHIAVAWDESLVAARALGDALPLLAPGGQVSVLTVLDEKSLSRPDFAETLTASLKARGFKATAVNVERKDQTISAALQDSALAQKAQLLVMGGFGHSRLRDFVLGGATKGVFSDLRLPVLMAH